MPRTMARHHIVTAVFCALARVVAVDIVGRGGSDYLAKPELYGYPLYVADMIAFVQGLELSDIDWVGTSMGSLR